VFSGFSQAAGELLTGLQSCIITAASFPNSDFHDALEKPVGILAGSLRKAICSPHAV
jgi:hypothetical protein